MSHCVKCGTGVEQPTTGRPRSYCGPVCRRAAEFKLRRLQRRLEAAEQSVLMARRTPEFGPGSPQHHRRQLAFAEGHLAGLEERLRTLLSDPETKGQPM